MYSLRHLLIAIVLAVFTFQANAEPKKLLILDSQSGAPYDEARDAMLDELRLQGFVPDQNLIVRRYDVQNKLGLAKRWLRTEVPNDYDVIFVNGTIASRAAMKFGYDDDHLKFVFCSVTDPVGIGLINQLGKTPYANFTGVPYGVPIEDRLSFLMRVMPEVKAIGIIHTDMPQSLLYVDRLKVVIRKPEFSHLRLLFKRVPFINTDKGHIRMAQLSQDMALQIEDSVDVFLTPSDQWGIKKEYVQAISAVVRKPLMGLSRDEVQFWGANFGLYPRQDLAGKKAGKMVAALLEGKDLRTLKPEFAEGEGAINLSVPSNDHIDIPEALLKSSDIVLFQ